MASAASPPFSKWSESDHSGPILIGTTLCMLYWFVAGLLQQILSLARSVRCNLADFFLSAAMVAAFIQSTLILIACHNGLGRSGQSIEKAALQHAQKASRRCSQAVFQRCADVEQLYQASNVFYAVALGLVKCSSALFVANLTVKNMGSILRVPPTQKWTLLLCLALVALWTVGSAILLGLPCKTGLYGTCMGDFDRWVGVFVGDAITDLTISASAANVILRTKAQLRKRLVWYLPFLARTCVPLFAGLRLLTLSTHKLTHDPSIALWLFITLTQVHVMLAIVSAAIPALKQTLLDVSTNYGAANESRSASQKYGGSYALKRLTTKQQSRSRAHVKNAGDGESQDGIIRQDEFEIRYEPGEASDRGRQSEDNARRLGRGAV